jgi:hypothetical protein
MLAAGFERRQRAAKLVWLGCVLGVVDHDIVALRELQRVLDGTRLGAGLAYRHDEDLHVRVENGTAQGRLGLFIGALDDEHYLQPPGRIVERTQRIQEFRHDARLAQ